MVGIGGLSNSEPVHRLNGAITQLNRMRTASKGYKRGRFTPPKGEAGLALTGRVAPPVGTRINDVRM